MKADRSRCEIIHDVLRTIQEEGTGKKTRIMSKARLDWKRGKRYLDLLSEGGFIAECNPEPSYELTAKGRELLRRMKEVDEILVKVI